MSRKYVGQKRDTICFHWNADYLLENLSHKHHENAVYQKRKHLDDVIFKELVLESECAFIKCVSS